MTELTVISGKGGTGKTSLVGSLAVLSKKKVLVDCDVDAADLHLIIQNKVQQTNEFIGSKRAFIIENLCNNCGICLDYCRFEAIKHEIPSDNTGNERYFIDKLACDGCGVCVRHCPLQAIDFKEVISGEWYLSETPYGPLLHARLGMAEANSGKLVSILRQQARVMAQDNALELIIIDGPPGIGCPVIASITGTGFVLIVTEPSMAAIHDMERLMQLTAHFRIPTGICINKFDINPELSDRIEDKALGYNYPILGRIHHDRAVTMAQVNRKPVVEHGAGPATRDIRELWKNLKNVIS